MKTLKNSQNSHKIRILMLFILSAILLTLIIITINANSDPISVETENITENSALIQNDDTASQGKNIYFDKQNGQENVIYLPHGYIHAGVPKSKEFISSVVNELESLNFKYQFMNIGYFKADGTMASDDIGNLRHWVENSRATQSHQLIIGYINGSRNEHVNNLSTHNNIANFSSTLINEFGLDGIHVDFEPNNGSSQSVYYSNYAKLLTNIRQKIGTAHLSIAADTNHWSESFIVEISKNVDMINTLNYDTSYSDINQYQEWLKNSAIKYTNNSSTNVQLVPIIPAYKASQIHNPAVENITTAVGAINSSLQNGARVNGLGVWWWYEMTAEDKQNWLNLWANPANN